MSKIRIKQIKSSIKRIKNQKLILKALGLRGIGKEVTHDDSKTILGMIEKVKHLVTVKKYKNFKMNLNNLSPSKGSIRKNSKRLGRGQGSGKGGTSTRGHKGAKSRSGYSKKLGFEGGQMPLQRRIPKFGFKNINRTYYNVLNLDSIQILIDNKKIKKDLTKENLIQLGLISKKDLVKVLGRGELKSGIKIEANKFSKSAILKIKKAGGETVEIS